MSENTREIYFFKQKILDYYLKFGRHDLPWRQTKDTYAILVSEVMLQQTQVSRVLTKYEKWLKFFPTVTDLANSNQKEVLIHWQGLGYNRRGLSLYKLSKIIVQEYCGIIPLDIEKLKELPGIGDYTSKAVYTFSTNKPSVFIETNIRTVFLYEFFKNKEGVSDNEINALIKKTLDREESREWYYALMDYGSRIKKEFGYTNSKSKHYCKQSKFEGSKRQLRGMIIKELSAKEYTTKEEIYTLSNMRHADISETLSELVNEGFLVVSKGKIKLKV